MTRAPQRHDGIVYVQSTLRCLRKIKDAMDAGKAFQVSEIIAYLRSTGVRVQMAQRIDHDIGRIPRERGAFVRLDVDGFERIKKLLLRRFHRRIELEDSLVRHPQGRCKEKLLRQKRGIVLHLRKVLIGADRGDRNIETGLGDSFEDGGDRASRAPCDQGLRLGLSDMLDLSRDADVRDVETRAIDDRDVPCSPEER